MAATARPATTPLLNAIAPTTPAIRSIPVDLIRPGSTQARRHFDQDALEEEERLLNEDEDPLAGGGRVDPFANPPPNPFGEPPPETPAEESPPDPGAPAETEAATPGEGE